MASGMMPGSSGEPCMVCVLPDAVWPYAKMVPLTPSMAESITALATLW